MKAIQKINNNVAICIDEDGHELIAIGRGIGFLKMPHDIALKDIQETYYNVNPIYYDAIKEIPNQIIQIAVQIVNYLRANSDRILNPNLTFTLADHINFAIEQRKNGNYMSFSSVHDIEYLHPTEYQAGVLGVKVVAKELKIQLGKEQAYGIAFHILNSEASLGKESDPLNLDNVSEVICKEIESYYHLSMPRNDFNYSRFLTHVQYMIERHKNNITVDGNNESMLKDLADEYPEVYECTNRIADALDREFDWKLSREEKLYLMLHVNRLTSRHMETKA